MKSVRLSLSLAFALLASSGCTLTYPTHTWREVSIIDADPPRHHNFRVAFEGMPGPLTATDAGVEFVLYADFAVNHWGMPIHVVVPWRTKVIQAGDEYTSVYGIVCPVATGDGDVGRSYLWYMRAFAVHSSQGDEWDPDYVSSYRAWKNGATSDPLR